MIIQSLYERKLITPPTWLPTNCAYLTIMGSTAYGVSTDTSDLDVYGVCIPRKEDIFPHLKGEIFGFGKQKKRFEQWQEHHIFDKDALGGHGRDYDFSIFGIVKFFSLAMDNNPNIVDCLFTPANCILHSTPVGNMIRENRKLFLHKGVWHKMKGYAYSQLHKIASKDPKGKRLELVDKFGYDVKFAYHVVRLLLEAEMILLEHDLDLQRHNEQLKAIRRGEWTEEKLRQWASTKEAQLEEVYLKSTLRHSPDEDALKTLLLNCLEMHYGDLSSCIVQPDAAIQTLREIQELIEKRSKQIGLN